VIVIAGYLRLSSGSFDAIRPHMLVMIAASRAEKGCIAYTYARDVVDADTIRVFEAWHGQEDLDRHFTTPHLKAWRAALGDIGIERRELSIYPSGAPRPL